MNRKHWSATDGFSLMTKNGNLGELKNGRFRWIKVNPDEPIESPEEVRKFVESILEARQRATTHELKLPTVYAVFDGNLTLKSIKEAIAKTKDVDRDKENLAFLFRQVALPPGYRMLAAARFLFSPKTIERVFEPIVADLQHETFAAEHAGESVSRLRFISARYWLSFFLAAVAVATASIGQVMKVMKGN